MSLTLASLENVGIIVDEIFDVSIFFDWLILPSAEFKWFFPSHVIRVIITCSASVN